MDYIYVLETTVASVKFTPIKCHYD